MITPRVVIAPFGADPFAAAVRDGGGEVVAAGSDADGLVWLDPGDASALGDALATTPSVRWVQLPSAGVERFAELGLFADGRSWTCAKGAYGPPVAEHALALALAGLRRLPERIAATSWGRPAGTSLFGAEVTILGGGGIARDLLRLLRPFDARVTVVRRQAAPVPGAVRTLTTADLDDALERATVVFVALSLTPETTGIVAAPQLAAMDSTAWLVNVARGPHVVTDDLVEALGAETIAGAGLDVTDPEPLPDGHPLWTLDNCIITPHTADTEEMVVPLLANRVRANIAHLVAGEGLEGVVDVAAGY